MKQICILMAVVISAVAVLFLHGAAAPAPTPPEKHQTEKWEYGYLSTRFPRWETAEGQLAANGWQELAERLKVVIPEKCVDVEVAIMNHLGKQGWELVAIDSSGGGDKFFKRRIP
jgi:hypothetical protein